MIPRRILIGLSIPLVLIVVGLFVLLTIELSVRAEPTGVPATSLSSAVTIQADERLFTLMAALSATGVQRPEQ